MRPDRAGAAFHEHDLVGHRHHDVAGVDATGRRVGRGRVVVRVAELDQPLAKLLLYGLPTEGERLPDTIRRGQRQADLVAQGDQQIVEAAEMIEPRLIEILQRQAFLRGRPFADRSRRRGTAGWGPSPPRPSTTSVVSAATMSSLWFSTR